MIIAGYSLLQILVFLVMACAGCAIAYSITVAMGWPIPPIVLKVLGILALAFLGVVALVFLSRLPGML